MKKMLLRKSGAQRAACPLNGAGGRGCFAECLWVKNEKGENDMTESQRMESQDQVIEYLAESKEKLKEIIEKLQGVKWYRESDENVEMYRRRGAAVLDYCDDIAKMAEKLQS